MEDTIDSIVFSIQTQKCFGNKVGFISTHSKFGITQLMQNSRSAMFPLYCPLFSLVFFYFGTKWTKTCSYEYIKYGTYKPILKLYSIHQKRILSAGKYDKPFECQPIREKLIDFFKINGNNYPLKCSALCNLP